MKNKVVARFKNGSVIKGHTSDFFPNKPAFHLEKSDGTVLEIVTEDVKALFFVKDFDGDSAHNPSYEHDVPGGGKKLEITFRDGEKVTGYSQGYSAGRAGFFVVPADMEGNNERIYVVSSAAEVKVIT